MKKILFLNTTKLAVLSAMLLLAVFCTIGMSFTPAEEGENVGNPNDSTYVTGPRRGHWTNDGGCSSDTYSGTKDYSVIYAEVIVFNTKGEDITESIGDVSNIGVVKIEKVNDGDYLGNVTANKGEDIKTQLEWNCNIQEDKQGNQDSNISKKHQLRIKLTATDKGPTDDYAFVGWTTNKTKLDDPSQYKTNPYDLTVGFPNNNGLHNYNGTENYNPYPESNPYKITYYAHFSIAESNVVTLHPADFGAYSCTYTDYSDPLKPTSTYEMGSKGDDGVEIKEIETKGDIVLKAKPAPDYKFFGWYEKDGDNEVYFSYDQNDTISIVQTKTIYAKFIPSNWATYIVKGEDKRYFEFDKAEEAAASSSKVFLPITDGIVPYKKGGYSIRSGVTLLIPYEGTYRNVTSTPDWYDDNSGKAPKSFRTLTLAAGVKVTVNGAINVNAKLRSLQNTNGAQSGESGMINMQEGSTITLNNGANLYCWGIIYGKGEITANYGATVYESFQVNDYPGGKIMAPAIPGINPTGQYQEFIDYKVFPVRIFCFPNIQSKLHLHYGATEKVATAFASLGLQKDIIFISKSEGLFTITSEGSSITKWYDINEDVQHFELRGDANLKSVQFEAGVTTLSLSRTINSANYILPFTHNMRITLLPKENGNGIVNVTEDIAILPGAKISVGKNVTVKIAEDKALYVYDIDQWENNYTFANGVNKSVVYNRSKTISYDKTKGALTDAIFEVAGTIEINGALYTTSSGADIKGVDGGKVIFATQPPQTLPTICQFIQSNTTYPEIPITAAQLHNGEEWYKDKEDEFKKEYLATAEVSTSTTIQYANNHWGWMEIWKDHDGTLLNINNTCTKANNSSAYEHNVLPEGYTFIGWSTEVSDTNQEVIHTAHYSFGPELDIVDADNTNDTLTINATSFALSGWPYTVNGVEYARPADRMLTIPYGDKDPNEEIVIEVKDKKGTVVSCNKYIVPFVYTGTENMTDMKENSIVFVKSDTLTVGDALAKEIYVAPGAALQVNGTLSVEKLVLRTTPFEAAILTNKGSIEGQVYYSRIARDTDFHLFAIPAGSNTAKVVLSDGSSCAKNSTTTPYGAAWQLREYNTARRAEAGADGANWDNIGVNADKITYSDVDIEASKGYELRSGSKYYREYLFPVTLPTTATPVQVTAATGAAGAADAGWNILCSPYTYIYTAVYNDPARGIKVSWQKQELDGSYSYIQVQPDQIKPAVPFAYQTKENGSLNFSADSLFLAPRKQSAAEALTETEWVHLDIFDAYGEGDETSLFVHPTRFEQTYKTGIDVAKQSLTAARPIIYSAHAYGDMAFAGVADSLLENGIDIAVYSPAAQELTFSLRENKFLHRLEYLWLADNETGERTDLLMDDYTCRANAGTIKGRFVLNGRFKAPQISTGLGNTQTDYNIYAIGNNIAISGVEQGTPIYVFDAVGHMIYTTAATSDEVIVPAPCAGVYMLTIGGQTAKLVINQ